jgi:hypothetical protein
MPGPTSFWFNSNTSSTSGASMCASPLIVHCGLTSYTQVRPSHISTAWFTVLISMLCTNFPLLPPPAVFYLHYLIYTTSLLHCAPTSCTLLIMCTSSLCSDLLHHPHLTITYLNCLVCTALLLYCALTPYTLLLCPQDISTIWCTILHFSVVHRPPAPSCFEGNVSPQSGASICTSPLIVYCGPTFCALSV